MPKTLHIALCDTNFPDRKQMERLLSRESDRRQNECLIYMETFGSHASVLATKRVYDGYFLDIPEENYSAIDLAKELRKRDIVSPIVFCISSMDYRINNDTDGDIYFLEKEIKTAELSKAIDQILLQKEAHHIPTIEFRNSEETYCVEPKDIIYINHEGRNLYIHMTDGQVKKARAMIENAFVEFSPYPSFFMPSKNYIINKDFIKKVSPFTITLVNKVKIPIPLGMAKKIKNFL